jgi:hypothetical protein
VTLGAGLVSVLVSHAVALSRELRGPEADHELKRRGSLLWQVGWVGALEDPVHVTGLAAARGGAIRAVGQQPSQHHELGVTELPTGLAPGKRGGDAEIAELC